MNMKQNISNIQLIVYPIKFSNGSMSLKHVRIISMYPEWNVHDVLVEKHSPQDTSKTLICPKISPLSDDSRPFKFYTVILVVLHTFTNCWGYADSIFFVGVCSSWGNIIPILWLKMFNRFETTRIPIAIGYDLV